MQAPDPSPRELRWSFLAVLTCALMLTATLCWGIVHRVNQSDDIVHIASASADTVERLNVQIDALTAQLGDQAKAAKEQRRELRRQNRTLNSQLDALVKFLRAHGLSVPDVVARAGPESLPKAHGPRGPKPTQHPASPAPTATPTPTASPDPVTDLVCGLLPLLCR